MYTLRMAHAVGRAVTIVLLALTVGGVPLVLDVCATTCQFAGTPVYRAAAPSCHHSASTSTRVGHAPGSCSHDQDGTSAATLDSKSAQHSLAFVAAFSGASIALDLAPPRHGVVDRNQPPDRPSRERRSPLRI